MRRTHLCVDDQLWQILHAGTLSEKTTVSELVRRAARDRYIGDTVAHQTAMENFIGIRKPARVYLTAQQKSGNFDAASDWTA